MGMSYSGGRAGSLSSKGDRAGARSAEDQLAEDKSVDALIHNYRAGTPIVLLVDDRYPLFPYDLGQQKICYIVLGWFMITHVWGTLNILISGNFLIQHAQLNVRQF